MLPRSLLTLNGLLVFIPIALALNWIGARPAVVFLAAALAIVPLAKLMGSATEVVADILGPQKGGLLNATLGNAPENIIGLFALSKGLADMVKASITGSIIGNLLFGMGLAMIAGGLKYPRLCYDTGLARLNGDLLMLAMFGLIVPAVFHFGARSEAEISLAISVVLFGVYQACLIYTLGQDESAAAPSSDEAVGSVGGALPPSPDSGGINVGSALGVLVAATTGLALMSEILTDAVESAARSLGLAPLFAGVFLLATDGNAAEKNPAPIPAQSPTPMP